jgi:hypothetical protein
MKYSAEMRRCLIDCDVAQMRKLDNHLMPHLSHQDDAEVLVAIHMARTLVNFIPIKLRAYSHRWLLDQNYPSGLPDQLKPLAERSYPRVVACVGIASQSGPGRKTRFNRAVEKIMSDAVLETYADGHENEPDVVKARMLEKRAEFKRRA